MRNKCLKAFYEYVLDNVVSSLARWLRGVLGFNRNNERQSIAEYFKKIRQYLSVVYFLARVRLGLGPGPRDDYRFMCIGAQKAGTTWFHKVLSGSGRFSLGQEKESHYFDLGRLESYEKYMSQFDSTKIIGEIAPDYSALSLWRIKAMRKLFPNMKVFLFVRDPLDRAWSAAKMEVCWLRGRSMSDVPDKDFVDYMLSKRCLVRSDYTAIIRRWSGVFGNDFRVYDYARLTEHPVEAVREIVDFICDESFPLNVDGERVFGGVSGEIRKSVLEAVKARYIPMSGESRRAAERYIGPLRWGEYGE